MFRDIAIDQVVLVPFGVPNVVAVKVGQEAPKFPPPFQQVVEPLSAMESSIFATPVASEAVPAIWLLHPPLAVDACQVPEFERVQGPLPLEGHVAVQVGAVVSPEAVVVPENAVLVVLVQFVPRFAVS